MPASIVVMGASSGGIDAIRTVLSSLPHKLDAPILIVQHVAAHSPGALPDIFKRLSALPVKLAVDKEKLENGVIYFAPPDHHLLVKGRILRTIRGPKENRHRPAIDPLFRSAALDFGKFTVGVILSGLQDDGSAGLQVIKNAGGTTIVQDPNDAIVSEMPQNAIDIVQVDYILPARDIAQQIVRLVNRTVQHKTSKAEKVHHLKAANPAQSRKSERKMLSPAEETVLAEFDMHQVEEDFTRATPSVFTCPECKGVLWEVKEGALRRFRCKVGHAYTAQAMASEQADKIDEALWVALTTLEETAALARKMGNDAREKKQNWTAKYFEARLDHAQKHAKILRQLLLDGGFVPPLEKHKKEHNN